MTNLILTYHVKLYSTVCIIHKSLVKPYSLTLLIEFKGCGQMEVKQIHPDEGFNVKTTVVESFTIPNLPYRPCG